MTLSGLPGGAAVVIRGKGRVSTSSATIVDMIAIPRLQLGIAHGHSGDGHRSLFVAIRSNLS